MGGSYGISWVDALFVQNKLYTETAIFYKTINPYTLIKYLKIKFNT
jgi:hypothetical protein